MKVIISHDVDHITVWEHFAKDAILPKQLVRTHMEFFSGKLSLSEYGYRFSDFFRNKWNGVQEVIAFNKSRKIKSVFFVGVNNAKGLSYSLSSAVPIIKTIVDNGFEVGVHGISFTSRDGVEKEFATFRKVSGLSDFGMRMHYLRSNKDTFEYINQVGYLYDATESGMRAPYKKDGLWEFPLQIMDGWMMQGDKTWQTRNLQQAKAETLKLIEEAKSNGLPYLSVLFHDRYFSKSFRTWKNWYTWLIDYLLKEGYEFLTYTDAIKELEGAKKE